ncbi:hypothetical protein BH11BAC6_BH11BAC6_16870 [soil metagenome]
MQKLFITVFLFVAFYFGSCVSATVQTQRDMERLLPPVPATFSKADSARLIRNWTIGIRLYKNNCASCHGIFGKSKDTIPNFSQVQYDDYKSAYLAGDSANHAVMAKMTPEEMNDVLLFLTDLKRDEHNKVVITK